MSLDPPSEWLRLKTKQNQQANNKRTREHTGQGLVRLWGKWGTLLVGVGTAVAIIEISLGVP